MPVLLRLQAFDQSGKLLWQQDYECMLSELTRLAEQFVQLNPGCVRVLADVALDYRTVHRQKAAIAKKG